MKSLFEENGGTYAQVGDVLIPNLVMEEQPKGQMGKFGRMRLEYLKKWNKGLYNDLLLSAKLRQHLLVIDRYIFREKNFVSSTKEDKEQAQGKEVRTAARAEIVGNVVLVEGG